MIQISLHSLRRNCHPADELGDVREQMRLLRLREAELRQELLAMPTPSSGSQFDVDIRTQRRRVFLTERLPRDILEQPVLWDTRVSKVVTLRKRQGQIDAPGPQVAAPAGEDDFQVIEPF